MILYSGTTFDTWMWGNSNADLEQAVYGGRSVIQWGGGTTSYQINDRNNICTKFGGPNLSTEAVPIAWHIRGSLAAASETITGSTPIVKLSFADSNDGPAYQLYFRLYVVKAAGPVYTLVGVTSEWGSGLLEVITQVTLATITVGDEAFYSFDAYLWRDKIAFYDSTGTLLGTTTFGTSLSPMYFTRCELYMNSTCNWKLEHLLLNFEEAYFTPAASESVTRRYLNEGFIYLVSKTALAANITAGGSFQYPVAVGDVTETATNTTDYLVAFVDSNNKGGGGCKATKNGSDEWAENDWELS